MSILVDIPFYSRGSSSRHMLYERSSFDQQLAGDILLDHRLPNMGLGSTPVFGRRPTSPPSPDAALAVARGGGDPFMPVTPKISRTTLDAMRTWIWV